ncbi:MAG: type VI secretion system-associated protein TagF [Zoogloea sp.]|jgi:type VI secretion system protein ImpM|nr:type VI secretion system-associated protein TagF [Zoogloea sp.]
MSAAGWYGKLPVLGDFAQRRLPHDFVVPWDAWLQRGVAGSQAALGNGWLDTYLTAHVWHFVLMPGVLGNHGWAGVWTPSVDRVGRYFPFTLAAPLPAGQALGASAPALGAWLKQLEEAARLALQLEHDIEQLEGALASLGPPPASHPPTSALEGVGARFARREELIDLTSLPGDCLDALATGSLLHALDGYSTWWCYNNDSGCGGFAHRGLPDAAFLLKMLAYSPGG